MHFFTRGILHTTGNCSCACLDTPHADAYISQTTSVRQQFVVACLGGWGGARKNIRSKCGMYIRNVHSTAVHVLQLVRFEHKKTDGGINGGFAKSRVLYLNLIFFFFTRGERKNLFTHATIWRRPTHSSITKGPPAPTISSMPSRCRGNLAATPTVLWCLASLNLRATIGRSTSSFPPDELNALSGESDILAVQTALCRGLCG